MPKAHNVFLTSSPRRCLLALWLLLGFGSPDSASAQAPYDDANTPEGWAWSQIKRGDAADFNQRCGTIPPLDPNKEEAAHWQDNCRKISARFLQDLLTRAPWREAVPFEGVRINGAQIAGDVDLENATLIRPIEIFGSRIEGSIKLSNSRTDSLILLAGSLMNGYFAANGLRAGSDLSLANGMVFKSAVVLNGAKIDGGVDMTGASFDDKLDAAFLQVGGSLYMVSEGQNKASFKDVDLRGAKITGQIFIIGAIDGKLDAAFLQVGGSLYMVSEGQSKASFKDVDLTDAKITGQLAITGATFDGKLNADNLQVGSDLYMRSKDQNKASFKGVNLNSTKITGQLAMTGASFDGKLDAEGLRVGGDLFMRDANYADEVVMVFTHIGGNLDLRGATMAGLNLSGGAVGGDFVLGEPGKRAVWKGKNGEPGTVTLRNTHINDLMDTEDAWPEQGHLHLDGFSFSHLGGFKGETGREMRGRGMNWWDNWARRDTNYSPAPYALLTAALTSAGDRDAANEIRYLGRVRERETQNGLGWVWSGALQYVAGFGIGGYTFRVLYWIFAISFLGALYLWTCVRGVRDDHHGLFWCFGASLARLLPGIEVNKEFEQFFHDPERERLTGLQSSVFSAIGIMGFVLGAILIAALSGLTQSP